MTIQHSLGDPHGRNVAHKHVTNVSVSGQVTGNVTKLSTMSIGKKYNYIERYIYTCACMCAGLKKL